MEYVIFAAALLGILILLFLKGLYDYRQEQKRFRKRLHTDYGKKLEREYRPEWFTHICRYSDKHAGEFPIDEITWCDLNMDEVFKQMNYTYSSAGEEYLYYLLRNPQLEETYLVHMEEVIRYFDTHMEEREELQFIFSKLGKIGKFSIYDYLDYLDDLGERSNRKHYLALLLMLISIGIMVVNFSVGILALLAVVIYNNVTYFGMKKEIEPYITSFAYIFRLLNIYPEFKKHRAECLGEEFEEMELAFRQMDRFQRGSGIVMSGTRAGGSGSPLDMLMDFFRMGFHIDLIKFNQMLGEVRRHLDAVDTFLTHYGYIESCIAIGEYRAYLGDFCVPSFHEERRIRMVDGYHPMLTDPVRNTFETRKGMLITGSNASGKSTFLKTVAINALLAQSIHTCLAGEFETCFFRICSSMSLKDDVLHGESYYIVEIKSIKRILDLIAHKEYRVLCFVDEVLRGTNTVERIAASSQILKSLNSENSMCFVATHDIELTSLLEDRYENYHFREEVTDGDVTFSYQLLPGKATTRNAIRLLSIMGYQENIIQKAEQMALEFVRNSHWQMLD